MAEDAFDKYLRKMNELVEGFRINLRSLRDEQTPEAVIRQEYIDTFWTLLGWDVANSTHRSSAEKDVVIEATVGTVEEEQTRSRRPDYIFRIDGFPRFIVEAKKPAIDIERNKDAIFQAKTYAWSAQIPFVILTNFEQFRLFDATVKPYHSEPERGIIDEFDLRFEDYTNQWDILQKTFSREAVANGSLEQLLAKIKHVRKGRRIRGIDRLLIDLRGTEPVDQVFLQHLEDFRLRFARDLFDENRADFPEPHTHHGAARLTEATQRLIDRLVFIRVCEDRDITPYGELRDIVNNSSQNRLDLYPQLTARFRRFDEEYNGYLFKPNFSEQLKVSPELLADFIRSLYPPEGAYRFDAIGDDILGIIYERFLGSTITVKQNNVEAEPKPEVRHAGGVYYTPRFVVNTIIRRVVGPKIKEKSPLEVLNTKILDPACGSGSFLIAALQFLFDHCVRYISEHPEAAEIPASPRAKEKKVKIAFKDNEDNWHLSPKFRSQLLASCIYGVDIDAQAVEVTIMSLYLKLLEGRLPPNWQREFLQSRLLPPLDNNICCGNSLLSQADFDRYWDNKFGSLFGGDLDLKFRINAFDWNSQTRGFGRLLDEHKGFDCIIGNPPYIRVQELKKWEPEECEFYKAQYKSAAKGNYDIYVAFIEKGLQLLPSDGLLGFICPNKVLNKEYAFPLREQISLKRNLRELIHFGANQIFTGATTYTCIIVLQNNANTNKMLYVNFPKIEEAETIYNAVAEIGATSPKFLKSIYVNHPKTGSPWSFSDSSLINQMESFPRLNEIADVFVGVQTDADDVYYLTLLKEKKDTCEVFCSHANKNYEIEKELLLNLLQGTNVDRFNAKGIISKVVFPFTPDSKGRYKVISNEKMASDFPYAYSFFKDNAIKSRLQSRAKGKLKDSTEYWDFIYRKNLAKQSLPKICVPRLAQCLTAMIDCEGGYCLDNVDVCGIIPKRDNINLYYLTALLNSKLLDNYMKNTVRDNFRGGYLSLNKQFLGLLPIKICSASDKKMENRIIKTAKCLIELKTKRNVTSLSDREHNQIERDIEANETRINELVCELYGVDKIPS